MDPWIKIRTNLHEQREVVLLSKKLKISQEHALGLVVRLWGWADSNTADGNMKDVAAAFIDELVHQPGFAGALVEAGWLQIDGENSTLPNWALHNGKCAKARAQTTKRVSVHRNG